MRDEKKPINAMMILEIIGRPAEHLTETLRDIIGKIDEEKGVSVTAKNIKEPVPMKDREDFFTTFAEVEVETKELIQLAILIFKYMPAHVEVISPEYINIDNKIVGDLFSEVARRLHGYEEILRMMQNERVVMENKLKESLQEDNSKKDKPNKKTPKKNNVRNK